jgi:hypothetical protein
MGIGAATVHADWSASTWFNVGGPHTSLVSTHNKDTQDNKKNYPSPLGKYINKQS